MSEILEIVDSQLFKLPWKCNTHLCKKNLNELAQQTLFYICNPIYIITALALDRKRYYIQYFLKYKKKIVEKL